MVRDDLLGRLDRREGYESTRDARLNGYVRTTAPIELENGTEEPALVYLSNPDPDCPHLLDPRCSRRERAKALINATPLKAAHPNDSRGLYYLERTRQGLLELGIRDPELDRMAGEVQALAGPWTEIVAAPFDG